MKNCIVVLETVAKHDKASLKRLREAGLKPNKTVAWLFLLNEEEADRQPSRVLKLRSQKHAKRIYDILTRMTLTKYSDDPTNGMFIGMSGRWLSKTVLEVVRALNIPKDEIQIFRGGESGAGPVGIAHRPGRG